MARWLPLTINTKYEVSDAGMIRNAKTGYILKPFINEWGYPQVILRVNGKPATVRIHRAVLLAFVGKPKHGFQACHNDGNPANNLLSNLRWDTMEANQRDRVRHGTTNRGERSGMAKLTASQVLAIRNDPRSSRKIAAEYGLGHTTVINIKHLTRWKHLE